MCEFFACSIFFRHNFLSYVILVAFKFYEFKFTFNHPSFNGSAILCRTHKLKKHNKNNGKSRQFLETMKTLLLLTNQSVSILLGQSSIRTNLTFAWRPDPTITNIAPNYTFARYQSLKNVHLEWFRFQSIVTFIRPGVT